MSVAYEPVRLDRHAHTIAWGAGPADPHSMPHAHQQREAKARDGEPQDGWITAVQTDPYICTGKPTSGSELAASECFLVRIAAWWAGMRSYYAKVRNALRRVCE